VKTDEYGANYMPCYLDTEEDFNSPVLDISVDEVKI
jgi:hypothetical protein